MNISKLNPVGYETKTEKGNTYEKSNIAKTACIALPVIGDIFVPKNSAFLIGVKKGFKYGAKNFQYTEKELNEAVSNMKLPGKLKSAVITAGLIIDTVIGLALGSFIDNKINKKRAEKADKQSVSV